MLEYIIGPATLKPLLFPAVPSKECSSKLTILYVKYLPRYLLASQSACQTEYDIYSSGKG